MSVADEIAKLGALRAAGTISDAEFEGAKRKLLAAPPAPAAAPTAAPAPVPTPGQARRPLRGGTQDAILTGLGVGLGWWIAGLVVLGIALGAIWLMPDDAPSEVKLVAYGVAIVIAGCGAVHHVLTELPLIPLLICGVVLLVAGGAAVAFLSLPVLIVAGIVAALFAAFAAVAAFFGGFFGG